MDIHPVTTYDERVRGAGVGKQDIHCTVAIIAQTGVCYDMIVRMGTRVLLINPPQTLYHGGLGFNAYFPLGLLSIAAVIDSDCTVSLYDCLVSDFSVRRLKDRTAYGAKDADIVHAVARFRPDIVGISIPFSSQRQNAFRVARLVKNTFPKTIVVVGGPDASVCGQDILRTCNAVDICVQGEGEYAMRRIVRQFARGRIGNTGSIPGLHYRSRGRVRFTGINPPIPDLDKLPFPKYDLIRFSDYFDHPALYANRSGITEKSISVITSRGCPFNCIFCSVRLHMGKTYRTHSPEYVLKHLKLLVETYGVGNIHFEDDNLTLNRVRFERILKGIIGNDWKIRWDTPNGVRVDTLTPELLGMMKRSGLAALTVAVESGSQRVLSEIIDKRLDLAAVRRAAAWCRELDIPLWAFYIIGFPGEKQYEMRQTTALALSLLRHYDVHPYLFIANPLLGTRLHDVAESNGYLTHAPTEKLLAMGTALNGTHLIATPDFSAADIDGIVREYSSGLSVIDGIKAWGYDPSGGRCMRAAKRLLMRYLERTDSRLSLGAVILSKRILTI